ncbi:hypothetical protein [Collimonas arenae]|nr:hypothetical protein [Collimonas arenae]
MVDPQQLIQTLSPALEPHSLSAIAAAPQNLQVGLILGGPDFMKR